MFFFSDKRKDDPRYEIYKCVCVMFGVFDRSVADTFRYKFSKKGKKPLKEIKIKENLLIKAIELII